MSELNFPKNPAVGQEYTFNSLLYMFDGVKWVTKGTGYNPVQDLYEMLASDAGASFVGANGHDNVQAALEDLSANVTSLETVDADLQAQINTKINANFISRFDREALRRSYADAGYNLVAGSFEVSGTLVNANDVLLHEVSGKAFSGPAGPVTAGTAPTSGGFVDVSNKIVVHFSSVREMSNTGTAFPAIGTKCRTGKTTWIRTQATGSIADFTPTSELFSDDFGLSVVNMPAVNFSILEQMRDIDITHGCGIRLASGKFPTSGGFDVLGGDGYTDKGNSIIGAGSARTILFIPGSNTDKTQGAINLGKRGGLYQTAWNIRLNGFSIEIEQADAWSGLVANRATSRLDLKNFDVTGNAYNAVWLSNPYVCTFKDLILYAKNKGFYIDLSGTTNRLDNIGVFDCDGVAYTLKGTYSSAGNLFAENCTGELFEFRFFSGTVQSLGSEQPVLSRKPNNVVTAVNSSVKIGAVYHLNPNVTNDLANILSSSGGSSLDIEYLRIAQNDGAGTLAQCNLLSQTDGVVRIEDISSAVTFTEGGATRSNSASLLLSPKNSTGIAYARGNRRPFTGAQQDFWDAGRGFLGSYGTVVHAMYHDSYGGIAFGGSNGTTDYRFTIAPSVGDWYMENRPDINKVAGYVVTQKGSDTNTSKAEKIPLALSGASADRPTTGRYAGMQYYDTTLGKPIYWSGSAWKDAIGSTV